MYTFVSIVCRQVKWQQWAKLLHVITQTVVYYGACDLLAKNVYLWHIFKRSVVSELRVSGREVREYWETTSNTSLTSQSILSCYLSCIAHVIDTDFKMGEELLCLWTALQIDFFLLNTFFLNLKPYWAIVNLSIKPHWLHLSRHGYHAPLQTCEVPKQMLWTPERTCTHTVVGSPWL